MKKTGIIFACIGSAGVGSLITYILTRRHFQKKLEKLVDENFKPKPHEKIRDARNDPDNPFGELWPDKETEQAFKQKVNDQLGKYHFWPEEETEQGAKAESEKEPEESTEEPEEEVDDISIDPYETTAEEFMASEEKMYFTVYKDEVIADDKDKVVRNPEYYIGKDILGRLFSKIGDDPLYVCNPVLNVVIEITYALDDYGA